MHAGIKVRKVRSETNALARPSWCENEVNVVFCLNCGIEMGA